MADKAREMVPMLSTSTDLTRVNTLTEPGFSVGYKYAAPSGATFEVVNHGDLADIYSPLLQQHGPFYVVRNESGREQRVSAWTIQQGTEVGRP